MEAKDIIELEKSLSDITGRNCWIEYTRYDGNMRLDEAKVGEQCDGLVRENLHVFPNHYHNDYFIAVRADKHVLGYNLVASMRLYQMPGCCGVAVSSASLVTSTYRRKGINTILNKFRIDLAKHMRYTVLMCTDITSNIGCKKTLTKNGWNDIHQFRNQRTNNTVDVSLINLV